MSNLEEEQRKLLKGSIFSLETSIKYELANGKKAEDLEEETKELAVLKEQLGE